MNLCLEKELFPDFEIHSDVKVAKEKNLTSQEFWISKQKKRKT